MTYTIWGTSNCKWCKEARDLLDRKNIEYTYVPLTADNLETFLELTNGAKTVPQIFDPFSQRVGGYEDLVEFLKAQER